MKKDENHWSKCRYFEISIHSTIMLRHVHFFVKWYALFSLKSGFHSPPLTLEPDSSLELEPFCPDKGARPGRRRARSRALLASRYLLRALSTWVHRVWIRSLQKLVRCCHTVWTPWKSSEANLDAPSLRECSSYVTKAGDWAARGTRTEKAPRLSEREFRLSGRVPGVSERAPRLSERDPRLFGRVPRLSEWDPGVKAILLLSSKAVQRKNNFFITVFK